MFRILSISVLSLTLLACGGGSDDTPESSSLYVNTNQQSVGFCTHIMTNSQEDYDFSLSNGYSEGKCPTQNTVAQCDLSAVNNDSGMGIYYYSNSSFGHAEYQQGCEILGGVYIQGAIDAEGLNPSPSEEDTIGNVPLIAVDTAATEYQNYITEVGRTGLGEVWNIKEKSFQRFVGDAGTAGLESYGTFDSDISGYRVSIFRSEDDGSGTALFGFNHSTGAYNQITDTRWSDNSVCITYKFDVGVFIGGKAQPDSNCWENSTYGFYIDPYLDSDASPIAIGIVDEIVNGTAKPIMSLAGSLKGYFNKAEGKVYILNGAAEFDSYAVNAELNNAEPINYLSDSKILFRLGNAVYKYSLEELTSDLTGTDITDSLSSNGSISSIFLIWLVNEKFYRTATLIDGVTYEHAYYAIDENDSFTKKASIETSFGSSLLSTASYYVTASYDETVDSYNEFSEEPSPTASFKYFDKVTGLENPIKALSADINGSGCMIQGDNEFAVVHDNDVSFINDDATLNTYANNYLFYMYDASKGIYGDGAASFIVNSYETGNIQYLKDGSYLGKAEISNGGSLYGCYYGDGLYIDNSFFAKTSQMSADKFLYGDLTGEVNVY
jgi:hypothetical protein